MTHIKQRYCKNCGTPLFYKRPKTRLCRTCVTRKTLEKKGINSWTPEEISTLKTVYALKKEQKKLVCATRQYSFQIKTLTNELKKRHNPHAIYFQANHVLKLNQPTQESEDVLQDFWRQVRVEMAKTAGRLNQ